MEPSESNTKPSPNEPDIVLLSFVAGVIWVAIGLVIIHFFQDESFADIMLKGSEFTVQLLAGTAAGLAFGCIGVLMMKQPKLRAAVDEYAIMKQVKELSLNNKEIGAVSFFAGVSEEILFRAAIQPIVGVWLTSVIFIAIHGYIKFGSIPQTIFTLFTFSLSVLLGFLFIWFGIVAAMTAHALYDAIVLYKLSKETKLS
ncbi:MAG: CPBP family intramembrane metalloprotease [Balneolaceae bacterium]|nr:MAG: CPBP family intramembrane metalloprotease [Balneolaceae bacterium]